MLPSRHDTERTAALDRLRGWTRVHFRLPDDATIMTAEVACTLPGCPPLETVVVFWSDEAIRHQFKLFKPAAAVLPEDLPPAWLKPALVVDENANFECC